MAKKVFDDLEDVAEVRDDLHTLVGDPLEDPDNRLFRATIGRLFGSNLSKLKTLTYISNFNTLNPLEFELVSGQRVFVHADPSTSGRPYNGYFAGELICSNETFTLKIYASYLQVNNEFIRVYRNGLWGDWQRAGVTGNVSSVNDLSGDVNVRGSGNIGVTTGGSDIVIYEDKGYECWQSIAAAIGALRTIANPLTDPQISPTGGHLQSPLVSWTAWEDRFRCGFNLSTYTGIDPQGVGRYDLYIDLQEIGLKITNRTMSVEATVSPTMPFNNGDPSSRAFMENGIDCVSAPVIWFNGCRFLVIRLTMLQGMTALPYISISASWTYSTADDYL